MTGVIRLEVASPDFKQDIIECLEVVIARVRNDEVTGVMLTVALKELEFDSISVGNMTTATKIGYLMAHVDTLIKAMKTL